MRPELSPSLEPVPSSAGRVSGVCAVDCPTGGFDKRNSKYDDTGTVTTPPFGPNIPGASYYPEIARDQLRGKGSPAADAVPDEPSSEYYEKFDTREHWSWRGVLIGVGICVAVVVLLLSYLFVIPFSHSFSGESLENGTPSTFYFPPGASVKFSWQSVDALSVTFQVFTVTYDQANQLHDVLYNATAVSGSFSFTSAGLYYNFGLFYVYSPFPPGGAEEATFSGTYQAPLYNLYGQPNVEVP